MTNKRSILFKKYCKYYIKKLGITEYEFFIDIDYENKKSRATFDVDVTGKIAEINICKNWIEQKPTYKQIKKTAFHEVLECMLCIIRNMMEQYYSYNIVDKQIHKIIRILENHEFGITGEK